MAAHGTTGKAYISYPANDLVPAKEAAISQPLNDPIPTGIGPRYALVTGTNTIVALDGTRFRNVIFDGITVEYDGGPLVMENVYFVNCELKLKIVKNSRNLAIAILAPSPSTTFYGE